MKVMDRAKTRTFGILAGLCLAVPPAGATLVTSNTTPALAVPAQDFTTAENGTVNPSIALTAVPGYGTLTIEFGPFFNGQASSSPLSPPITISGTPTDPLTLTTSTNVVKTIVEVDNAEPEPDTEVLGGLPAIATNGFGGPIAILFSEPVNGVTLTAGYFDTIGATTITAYDSDGGSLGSVVNDVLGYESFNLSDSGGQQIGGLLLTTTDAGGFGIDGVGIFKVNGMPAPGVLALFPALAALLCSRMVRHGKRVRSA